MGMGLEAAPSPFKDAYLLSTKQKSVTVHTLNFIIEITSPNHYHQPLLEFIAQSKLIVQEF